MIRFAIVDGVTRDSERLKSLLVRYLGSKSLAADIRIFKTAFDFLNEYRRGYDVIFSEVALKGLDGISFAEKLRAVGDNTPIIFVTRAIEYAIDGYKVDAADFWKKPASYDRIKPRLDTIIDNRNTDLERLIPLKLPGGGGH